MLLFHGTTLENAKKIQKEGFSYEKQNWNCSEEETYFFHEDHFWKESGAEFFSEMWEHAIRETLDQARFSLAMENPDDYKGAVLVFDSTLMSNESEIKPDESCENMDEYAVALKNPDLKGLVAVIYSTLDEKETRPLFLSIMKNRTYMNMPEMSSILSTIVEALSKSDATYEILDEVRSSQEYQTVWINDNLLNSDYSREEVLEAA